MWVVIMMAPSYEFKYIVFSVDIYIDLIPYIYSLILVGPDMACS